MQGECRQGDAKDQFANPPRRVGVQAELPEFIVIVRPQNKGNNEQRHIAERRRRKHTYRKRRPSGGKREARGMTRPVRSIISVNQEYGPPMTSYSQAILWTFSSLWAFISSRNSGVGTPRIRYPQLISSPTNTAMIAAHNSVKK